jgi:hypothetical protein
MIMRAAHSLKLMNLIVRDKGSIMRRFLPWLAAKPGFIDWCVLVEDIWTTVRAASQSGIAAYRPMAFQREAPGQQEVRWQLAGAVDPHLPFLIVDEPQSGVRIPEASARDHANGVLAFASVTIAVRDPRAFQEKLDTYLGEPLKGPPIQVVQESTRSRQGLRRVDLAGPVTSPVRLDSARTSNAEIWIVPASSAPYLNTEVDGVSNAA